MNDQEIFDTVVTHLASSPGKAVHHQSCKYRTPNGGMCAVGCLIPNKFYVPIMDGLSGGNSVVNKNPYVQRALKKVGIDADNTNTLALLTSLQATHDRSQNRREMYLRLLGVSELYKLDTSVLKSLEEKFSVHNPW